MVEKRIFDLTGPRYDYQIKLAIPSGPVPEGGFPVLYILDGNAYFDMFHEITRLQFRRPEKTGVEPIVLVGIGYKEEEPFPAPRVYDFTPPATSMYLPPNTDGTPPPESGGAEAFLRFVEERIKPKIEDHYPVHKEKKGIFGHSLGGLFVLYTLFHRPDLFDHYISCSPTTCLNGHVILRGEERVVIPSPKRLFVGVETVGTSCAFDHVLALYRRLSRNHELLQSEFFASDGENHMSVVPAVISRALRFLYTSEEVSAKEAVLT